MAMNLTLAHLYASNIQYATTPAQKRRAINFFLSYGGGFSARGGGTRKRLMKQFNISQETIAPYLSKTIATRMGEMEPSYLGGYGELAGAMRELEEEYPGEAGSVLGMGFEQLRYANIPENLPVYESRRGQPGNIPELERHAGLYRGENYYEYAQRLARAGYRPSYGAAAPSGLAFQLRQTKGILGSIRERQPQIPIGQPVATPIPQLTLTPATTQPQPTYYSTPTQQYQSTYYQANGWGDKPFSYAYERPRLFQSYTGI